MLVKDGFRFSPAELDYVSELYASNDVQLHLQGDSRTRFKDTAIHATPLFKARFTSGCPAETDAEFRKRKRRANVQEKAALVQRPAETDEEFKVRMSDLPEVSGRGADIALTELLRR